MTEKNRQARFYTITPAGRKQLAREEESWARLCRRRRPRARLRLIRRRTAGGPPMSWFTRLRNVFRADAGLGRDRARDGLPPRRARRRPDGRRCVAGGRAARGASGGSAATSLPEGEHARARRARVAGDAARPTSATDCAACAANPVFCLAAVLTLAIGIGANTAVFTLLHGLLLRSLPVTSPQELVRIGIDGSARPAVRRSSSRTG